MLAVVIINTFLKESYKKFTTLQYTTEQEWSVLQECFENLVLQNHEFYEQFAVINTPCIILRKSRNTFEILERTELT